MCEDIVIYIFGYGSLIWRPGFPFIRKFDGYIRGWRRVFWQGSLDHRGTPEQPGRVVTLIKDKGEPVSETWGTVYCIPDEEGAVILKNLDYREKGGYVREEVDVFIRGVDGPFIQHAILYVATEKNSNFIGESPLDHIAHQIYKCVGPSGPNVDYLFNLADSLRKMLVVDEHVFKLEELVRSLIKQTPLHHHTHPSLLETAYTEELHMESSPDLLESVSLTTNTTTTTTSSTTTTTTTRITSKSVAALDEKENMQRKFFLSPNYCVTGVLYIDDGAVMALSQRGRSLLAAGVTKVEGHFKPHDLVSVKNSLSVEISRGVTNYSSEEIQKIMGQHSSKITSLLGFSRGDVIIHHQNTILV